MLRVIVAVIGGFAGFIFGSVVRNRHEAEDRARLRQALRDFGGEIVQKMDAKAEDSGL